MARPVPAESLALVAALGLVLAFVVSFATGLDFGTRQPRRPAPELRAPAVDPGVTVRGRVEVLNASGRAGLARDATARLRSEGFDVVYFGTAGSRAGDSTVVIDRTGNDALARAVAQTLGITRVVTQIDSALILDATVVLGRNYRARAPHPD
jgi:hypothetical protein